MQRYYGRRRPAGSVTRGRRDLPGCYDYCSWKQRRDEDVALTVRYLCCSVNESRHVEGQPFCMRFFQLVANF